MSVKLKSEREKKLLTYAVVIAVFFGLMEGRAILNDIQVSASTAPIVGNHSVQVDTSDLVDVDELPLFASMSGYNAGNTDGLISSDIFSRPLTEPEEVQEVVVVEIPEPEPEEVYTPDYDALVKEQFFLSAIMTGGAIINNIYHPVGDRIRNQLETGMSEHDVVLSSISNRAVVLRVEGNNVTLRLP